MEIREVRENKKKYLHLLLLADEQEDMVDRYLERGTMYILLDDGSVKSECVVTDEGNGILELKNMATEPAFQGKGYGRKLIQFISEQYRGQYSLLQVGTGDSPLTVPFYEKCGFHRSHRIKNFFTDHYDHPSYEAGIQLIDMIYLQKKLSDGGDAVLYIHGKGGSYLEAEQYKKNCPGFDVIGIDYEVDVPWTVEDKIRQAYDEADKKYQRIVIIASSIGAYFAMHTLQKKHIEKALFISPIVDMEKLILDMMSWAGVSEDELAGKGEIPTDFGETLSWEYLCFVREHPICWGIPTEILYGERDNLTSRETIEQFVNCHNARLTVMEEGEHWFHTKRQLEFLDCWMKNIMLKEKLDLKNALKIRTADRNDYVRVRDFYDSLIDAMEDAEYKPGWEKDVYPSQEFLIHSIENNHLYIGEINENIAACMAVNHEYNDGYQKISWSVKAKDSELFVIHALGVHPEYSGEGIAKQMVRKVIKTAHEQKIKAIRLDVLAGNIPAERVYTQMGFAYRGTAAMFYEDTGWTDYRLFEYIVPAGFA